MALSDDLAQQEAALLAPIPGPAPGGADGSFTPEFEALKLEIDKLTSLAGGTPDWTLVATGGADFLSRLSKDFRVASWLVVARIHQSSFAGLASGLFVFNELTKAYWDSGFPDAKRLRGRANLYAWLTEQCQVLIEPRQPSAGERDAILLASQLVTELDATLSEKLGDAHPGAGRLRGTLKNLAQSVAAPPPPAPPPPAAPAPAHAPPSAMTVPAEALPAPSPASPAGPVSGIAPVAAPPPAVTIAHAPSTGSAAPVAQAVAPPQSLDAARPALTSAVDVFVAVAKLRRDARIDDPAPYRMLREAIWLPIDGLPPTVEGPRTRARPPAPILVRMLEGHIAAARWPALIDAAEGAATSAIFWMDVHRYSAQALDRLGHFHARDAIGREVVRVLERLSGIEQLTFSDDTPFAAPETLAWIEAERRRFASGGNAGGGSGVDAEWEEAVKSAEAQAASGQLGDALAAAQALSQRAGSGRDRFRTILRAGRIALDRDAAELARAMLNGLLEDVERHELERWDPVLCTELYRLLLQAMRAENPANVARSRREALLFEKLCRLDPRAALLLARR